MGRPRPSTRSRRPWIPVGLTPAISLQVMSPPILHCEWQTARSPASTATTDRCAAAGVGAFGKKPAGRWCASIHEARAKKMRSDNGPRRLIVNCSDFKCSHSVVVDAAPWGDDVRLSDLEPKFTCKVCGRRGADVVRPLREGENGPLAAQKQPQHGCHMRAGAERVLPTSAST